MYVVRLLAEGIGPLDIACKIPYGWSGGDSVITQVFVYHGDMIVDVIGFVVACRFQRILGHVISSTHGFLNGSTNTRSENLVVVRVHEHENLEHQRQCSPCPCHHPYPS